MSDLFSSLLIPCVPSFPVSKIIQLTDAKDFLLMSQDCKKTIVFRRAQNYWVKKIALLGLVSSSNLQTAPENGKHIIGYNIQNYRKLFNFYLNFGSPEENIMYFIAFFALIFVFFTTKSYTFAEDTSPLRATSNFAQL